MAMMSMLAYAINATFERECGKHQLSKGRKAFMVSFRLSIDYDKEEGYRHLEVAFWGPQNYVQVWVRETWDVIPVEDLEYDEEADESRVKKGKNYRTGSSEWKMVADHDSCWRDGIKRVLEENSKRVMDFSGLGGTFWKTLLAEELPFTGMSSKRHEA